MYGAQWFQDSEDFIANFDGYGAYIMPEFTPDTAGMPARLQLPQEVVTFLLGFKHAVYERNITQIHYHYEHAFNQLTEQFYQKSRWPSPEREVAEICAGDEVFMFLYKELYYRHIYAKIPTGPTFDDRVQSHSNYAQFFRMLIEQDEPLPLSLPSQWLFDMIDEFVYQFQSFCHYRHRTNKLTESEVQQMQEMHTLWDIHVMLAALNQLIRKSNIREQLEAISRGEDPLTVAGVFGANQTYSMLGYFSLIGMLRLNCLLGDYRTALQAVDCMDFRRRAIVSFCCVPSCQITGYYYIGFAYLMMRRYQDAIETFCSILHFTQRTKLLQQPAAAAKLYDQDAKNQEKICQLLALALALYPMRIDESIQQLLVEKCGERLNKLARGDKGEFKDMFMHSCPKFVNAARPNYDGPSSQLKEANAQADVFMQEVHEQAPFGLMRSYLKLYSTIGVQKLASFMHGDEVEGQEDERTLAKTEEDLRASLMSFKHKMRTKVWSGGVSGLSGERKPPQSDVDFYIDNDMIHVADTKVDRHYGEIFLKQITKLTEINKQLRNLPI